MFKQKKKKKSISMKKLFNTLRFLRRLMCKTPFEVRFIIIPRHSLSCILAKKKFAVGSDKDRAVKVENTL